MKTAVYLVEDSEIMATLLRRLLEAIGASIVGQAASAHTAIADIPRVKPDVVIIDVALRQGNGFDVLKSIPRNMSWRRPVLVMLTDYALDTYRRAAKRFGVGFFPRQEP